MKEIHKIYQVFSVPCGGIEAEVFFVNCVGFTKVLHAAHIEVDQDNVLHLPAVYVQVV